MTTTFDAYLEVLRTRMTEGSGGPLRALLAAALELERESCPDAGDFAHVVQDFEEVARRARGVDPWRLAALRVPTGWSVRHNGFYEADYPSFTESEDLLWMEEVSPVTGAPGTRFIDLGWYGSREEGTFRLVWLDGDWDHVVEQFESRDRGEIVRVLEGWLGAERT